MNININNGSLSDDFLSFFFSHVHTCLTFRISLSQTCWVLFIGPLVTFIQFHFVLYPDDAERVMRHGLSPLNLPNSLFRTDLHRILRLFSVSRNDDNESGLDAGNPHMDSEQRNRIGIINGEYPLVKFLSSLFYLMNLHASFLLSMFGVSFQQRFAGSLPRNASLEKASAAAFRSSASIAAVKQDLFRSVPGMTDDLLRRLLFHSLIHANSAHLLHNCVAHIYCALRFVPPWEVGALRHSHFQSPRYTNTTLIELLLWALSPLINTTRLRQRAAALLSNAQYRQNSHAISVSHGQQNQHRRQLNTTRGSSGAIKSIRLLGEGCVRMALWSCTQILTAALGLGVMGTGVAAGVVASRWSSQRNMEKHLPIYFGRLPLAPSEMTLSADGAVTDDDWKSAGSRFAHNINRGLDSVERVIKRSVGRQIEKKILHCGASAGISALYGYNAFVHRDWFGALCFCVQELCVPDAFLSSATNLMCYFQQCLGNIDGKNQKGSLISFSSDFNSNSWGDFSDLVSRVITDVQQAASNLSLLLTTPQTQLHFLSFLSSYTVQALSSISLGDSKQQAGIVIGQQEYRIAHTAHLAGFAAGVCLGAVLPAVCCLIQKIRVHTKHVLSSLYTHF